MFVLKLLGSASIEGPDGPLGGQVSQRRRIALLALLARGRSVSRERLIAYLWPESDSERARHLLSDSLYIIHRALGKAAVLVNGDSLALNPEVVRCDVREFEDALQQRDFARAVSLYSGPFLDGVFLKGALEFERWQEAEREEFGRRYAAALEALAEETAEGGDLRGAVEWWRRLAAHDPYSARTAIRLMRALDAAGDRAGAIQHARVHSTLLLEELGAAQDPEVAALAERLRREPAVSGPEENGSAGPERQRSWDLRREPPAAEPPPEPPPEPPTEPPSADVPLPPPRAGPVWTSLEIRPFTVVLLALLGVTVLFAARESRQRNRPPDRVDTAARVAVFPFQVHGSGSLAYLGEGMVDLLSTKLDGAGELRSVDPRALLGTVEREGGGRLDPERARDLAARLGAGLFVLGSIVEIGGKLQLSASLYGPDGRARTTERVTVGDEFQVWELVDQLAMQLLAGYGHGPDPRLTQLAATTTTSLPALKLYLRGERAFRRHRHHEAASAFRRALALDSTFALAAYRLSTVSELGVDEFTTVDVATEAAKQAARFSARLPPTERMLVQGLFAFLAGNPAAAIRVYQALLRRQPSNVEAWFRLGDVQYHDNPLLGLSPEESREAFQRVLELDPDHQPARAHLALLAARAGDRHALDTHIPRLLRDTPEDSLKWLHLRAFAVADEVDQARYAAVYPTLGDSALWNLTRDLLEGTTNFRGVQRVAQFLTQPGRGLALRESGHLLLGWLELIHGRRRAANRHLDAVARTNPAAALEYRAVFTLPHFLPVPAAELRSVRDSLAAWNGTATENPYLKLYTDMWPSIRAYLTALLSARLRDDDAVQRHLSELEPTAPTPGRLRVIAQRKAAVRARVAMLRGEPATALALLEQEHFPGIPEEPFQTVNYVNFFERHLRPDLLLALGRTEEALRWYGASPWSGESYIEEMLWDHVHRAPFQLRRAQIYERTGRPREAAEHYARFIELWRDAEPELQPAVADARRRLSLLTTGGR